MKKYLLPQNGNFYKANLHCHSTLSDGKLSPEELKERYKNQGYSVLAYTDHDLFIPHHELTDEGFLALAGFEAEFYIERGNPNKKTAHICFLAKSRDMEIQPCFNKDDLVIGNAPKYIDKIKFNKNEPLFVREYSSDSINAMMKKAREMGFFVTYNHPTWSQENYEQYSKYEHMHAMEIYNHECQFSGYHSYVPGIYDDMLRLGKKILITSTDDNHNKFSSVSNIIDCFGGFIMIKADKLEYNTIMNAIFDGNFYSSQGPEIYELYVENNKIHVKCSDAVAITLNTSRRTAQAVYPEPNDVINEATFTFKDDDGYIRINIKDKEGKYADTNAYFLSDIK